MNRKLVQGTIVVAIAVAGLSVAGPAAAQSTKENFGSHVSHCAHVMGGFSGGHNPSMMHGTWTEHSCPM